MIVRTSVGIDEGLTINVLLLMNRPHDNILAGRYAHTTHSIVHLGLTHFCLGRLYQSQYTTYRHSHPCPYLNS